MMTFIRISAATEQDGRELSIYIQTVEKISEYYGVEITVEEVFDEITKTPEEIGSSGVFNPPSHPKSFPDIFESEPIIFGQKGLSQD